jgi:CHAD domain-containing protein
MSARSRPAAALLDRPLAEAARRIALAELERAESARAALAEGTDPEALHDLRVALRRLRSHLRAWRGELGPVVGGKSRRRLRDLAASTNPGRDAEVGAALARGFADELRTAATAPGRAVPAGARAAEMLAARLERRRDQVYAELAGAGIARFDALERRLRERLGRWEIRLDADSTDGPVMRAALAAEVRAHARALAEALAEAGSAGDDEAIHRARIEAKRLRYLIEPFAAELAGAREPLAALRALQDLLGDANDLAVLADELAADAAEAERGRLAAAAGSPAAAARRDGGRSGRAALARLVAERRARLREDFASAWSGDGASTSRWAGALEALLAELEGS